MPNTFTDKIQAYLCSVRLVGHAQKHTVYTEALTQADRGSGSPKTDVVEYWVLVENLRISVPSSLQNSSSNLTLE